MKINLNEVHLWYAYDEEISDNDLLTKYRELLSTEELAQEKRFFFQKHRHQYLITRALLRCVFSLYIEAIPPKDWKFKRNEYNKPYIANLPLPLAINFNLSHTEKMAVLAVTLEKEVGVDIEFLSRRNAGLDIAKQYFSRTELQDLLSLPAELQKDRFFALWTLKEAYIKACGMGLAISLDHFSYSFPRQGEVQISFDPRRDDHPQHWNLWQIKPNETHISALAIPNRDNDACRTVFMHEIVPLESIKEVHYPVIARKSDDVEIP